MSTRVTSWPILYAELENYFICKTGDLSHWL